MKRFITFILLILLFLTGCSQEEIRDSSSQEDDRLLVGMTHASPPNAFINDEEDIEDGVMVDIMNAIAEINGYEITYVPMPFSSLIPSLESGRIDVISAGVGITEERAEVVNFTEPVYGFKEALVVPGGNPGNVKSLLDLEGKSVGVSAGTFYYDYLIESDVDLDVKTYDTISEMLLDLTQSRIDAAINDTPIVHYLNEKNPDYNVDTVDEYDSNFLVEIGLIVAKENEQLLEELNSTIKELKENGTLEEIHQKWGTTWYSD